MGKLKVLFHGSPHKLIGDKLNPSQGDDSEERSENNQFGVYATDRKDLAIVMGILGCEGVTGGSIDEYIGDKLNARIYGGFPKQEYIYVYHVPVETFKQTQIDKRQFISLVAVKPVKIEKIKVKEFTHLIRNATKEETTYWMKKYKK
ncbi:hypothetical protein HN385_00660 [archaeon]|jgi:hypothetical protein|nr:hypothetical protein [archaeon]MBT3450940.1 hypothetical protein [archaeon]MBT6869586.1 hypothetical protein [archaeon]MBT7193422.1 hypothetical protein [archaeon]MBT7381013.1 hypothetical protein [archaeon]